MQLFLGHDGVEGGECSLALSCGADFESGHVVRYIVNQRREESDFEELVRCDEAQDRRTATRQRGGQRAVGQSAVSLHFLDKHRELKSFVKEDFVDLR